VRKVENDYLPFIKNSPIGDSSLDEKKHIARFTRAFRLKLKDCENRK